MFIPKELAGVILDNRGDVDDDKEISRNIDDFFKYKFHYDDFEKKCGKIEVHLEFCIKEEDKALYYSDMRKLLFVRYNIEFRIIDHKVYLNQCGELIPLEKYVEGRWIKIRTGIGGFIDIDFFISKKKMRAMVRDYFSHGGCLSDSKNNRDFLENILFENQDSGLWVLKRGGKNPITKCRIVENEMRGLIDLQIRGKILKLQMRFILAFEVPVKDIYPDILTIYGDYDSEECGKMVIDARKEYYTKRITFGGNYVNLEFIRFIDYMKRKAEYKRRGQGVKDIGNWEGYVGDCGLLQ